MGFIFMIIHRNFALCEVLIVHFRRCCWEIGGSSTGFPCRLRRQGFLVFSSPLQRLNLQSVCDAALKMTLAADFQLEISRFINLFCQNARR